MMWGANRAISTRWRCPTRRAGARRSPTCCFIAANEDREMTMHRRKFLGTAAVGGLLAGLPAASWAADAFAGLPNLAKDAQPIGVAEHKARLAKATALLRANGMDALLIERSDEHTSELQSLMR